MSPRAPEKPASRLPLVLTLAALGSVYLLTLLPGPGYHGDTAKFQFLGWVLGTPHATGYPTYLILNYLFTHLLFFADLAWSANLLSAVFSLLAALLLFRILRLLEVSPALAASVTTLFGLTYPVWSQSIVAEVYTLHLLFVCAVVYCFLSWRLTERRSMLLWGCALYALSFGNHLTTAALLPALVYWIAATRRRLLVSGRFLLFVAGAFLAGALQYAYIYWRTVDPSNPFLEMRFSDWDTTLFFLSGAQFRDLMFSFTAWELISERVPFFLSHWIRETHVLIPLAILGLYRAASRQLAWFLALIFAATAFWGMNYGIPDVWIYFIPCWLVTAILAATGLEYLRRQNPAWSKPLHIGLLLLLAVCAAIGWQRVSSQVHHHPLTHLARESKELLQAVERDAVVISTGYHQTLFFLYYTLGEGWQRQRDIHIVHHFSPEAIRDYLVHDAPLHLPEQRLTISRKLDVYAISESDRRALHDVGLTTVPFRHGLYQVIP